MQYLQKYIMFNFFWLLEYKGYGQVQWNVFTLLLLPRVAHGWLVECEVLNNLRPKFWATLSFPSSYTSISVVETLPISSPL